MKFLFGAVLIFFTLSFSTFAQTTDASLRLILEQDKSNRDTDGQMRVMTADEHLKRADIYMANRLFPNAREHWNTVLKNYPQNDGISRALFGIARSYMWEREYQQAVGWFDKLIKEFPYTKDGREGLAFKGASLVRIGKNLEAAETYQQYTVMFPTGEKIDSAYLNIIDAYREAGKYEEANDWVDSAVNRFRGKSTVVNALHARLRMEIYREHWEAAINAADTLLTNSAFSGSMTSSDEVKYLKAYALERSGKKSAANMTYKSIPANLNSYYYGLAANKFADIENVKIEPATAGKLYIDYPIQFRTQLLKSSAKNGIDPRFLLAIMKQESSFRTTAKSPAGARGLLQLVYDTALKYNKKAGYAEIHPDDLYSPDINIAIGSVYVGDLKNQFDGVYEAIAASYNAGEDNTARWLNRSRPKEAGIFSSEVGFAETKNYVFKVMNNYRVYRELYKIDLTKK